MRSQNFRRALTIRAGREDADLESGASSKWLEELSRNYESYKERLSHGLCRSFRNYSLRHHEAEDLAAEALKRAVTCIAEFDPAKRPFYVWLDMIATRCTLDYVNSAERRRATVNVDDLDARPDSPSHPDPAEEYARRKLAERVRAAVVRLPKRQQDAIDLCEYEQLSHEEAAAKMGVPLRRLRQLLYEGRAALGRNRELRNLYHDSEFIRKESRPRKS